MNDSGLAPELIRLGQLLESLRCDLSLLDVERLDVTQLGFDGGANAFVLGPRAGMDGAWNALREIHEQAFEVRDGPFVGKFAGPSERVEERDDRAQMICS